MSEEKTITLSSLRGIISLVLVLGLFGGGVAGAVVSTLFNNGTLLSGFDEDLTPSTQRVVVEESSIITTIDQASESVVSIIIEKEASQTTGRNIFPFDFSIPGFNFPFEQPVQPESDFSAESEAEYVQVGAGTGFVVSEDGLILTNKHVVSDPDAKYSIVNTLGDIYEVEILGTDPINDIAVVKTIDDVNLPYLELGDSDSIQIGQTVIAIGNSLGEFSNTVTKGVISGVGRRVTANDNQGGAETLDSAIQTDAAINPGNSGGPLLNVSGQVIGINTAVSREGQLIGFAIPINDAIRVIDSIEKYGKVVRPYLGVRYVIINKQFQEANNLSVDHGALLRRGDDPSELAVIPGGPADIAGLEENDIILSVNGEDITVNNSLARVLGEYAPGTTVTMTVFSDGEQDQIKVTLGEFESE